MFKTSSAAIMVLLAQFASAQPALDQLKQEVVETEQAFARTMADRDLQAFSGFVSPEAVFFGDTTVHRGRAAVVEAWAPYFKNKGAPFSWKPEHVEVLASGDLASSSGPVLDAQGHLIATFSSIWRKSPEGRWLIVFDRGNEVCECKQSAQ